MAKAATKTTKNWVSFKLIYEDELERFGRAHKPALQNARKLLSVHPYRYLDENGVQHQGGLSANFLAHASFDPGTSSAVCPRIVISRGGFIPAYAAYSIEIAIPRPLAVPVDPFHTGVAGRPPASHMAVAEFERRVKAGEVIPSKKGLGDEAAYLAQWWEGERRKNPKAPPLSAPTIRDRIRKRWNELAGKKLNPAKSPVKS